MPGDDTESYVVIGLDPPRIEANYASWAQRVAALLIDIAPAVAVIAIGFLLGRPTYAQETQTLNGHSFEVTVSSGPGIAYYVAWLGAGAFLLWNKGVREGSTGQSIGKGMLSLSTISLDTGNPPGTSRGVVRCILLVVDFAICYLGVLWPLWDEKSQCLVSDKASKTIVVKV